MSYNSSGEYFLPRIAVRTCKTIVPDLASVKAGRTTPAQALDDCVRSRISKYIAEPCKESCALSKEDMERLVAPSLLESRFPACVLDVMMVPRARFFNKSLNFF
jgi:hypothetical protein